MGEQRVGSAGDDLNQMPQFLEDLIIFTDRPCDFSAQKFAVALPHAVHLHFERALRDPKPGRDFPVWTAIPIALQMRPELLEEAGLPGGFQFPFQLLQSMFDDGHGPVTVELYLRSLTRGVRQKTRFGIQIVQGQRLQAAPSFPGRGAIPLRGEEVLECFQQKRTETATLPFESSQALVLQQTDKKILRYLLGPVWRPAPPPNKA